HRDIKPGNLLVTPDGTVKVLDFGIARLQSATQAALTRAATVVGTSHYMAPEQASGGPPDARADLYALGCVIYAMLTGAPPFEGENPMGVLYQHLHSAPTPVRERRPDVPAALDELVGGLLAKAPEDRPGSAVDVRARLAALSSQPGHTSVMPTVAQSAAATPGATGGGGAADGNAGFSGRAAVPPAAPGSDTDLHPQPEGETWSDRARRGWVLPAAAGAVIGLIVLLLIALALMPDGERTPRAKPPAETAESQSPSPSPTPSPTATNPAGRLAELREQLGKQIDAGAVEGEAGPKLSELLDKIGEDIQKGKLGDATKHTAEFREKLGEFADKGEVTAAAQNTLNGYADRLAQVLPPPEDGDGDEEDDDEKGKGRGKGKKDD
ncbi:MAG: protein kinase, partial [Micromonosporaceae bacterium]|nr:protein kinase [Micromonosporaceae bacterium]